MPDKFKKEVGFINSHSHSKKQLPIHKHCSNSSDSFSSFQYEPRKKNEQFSPYRHPIDNDKGNNNQRKQTKQKNSRQPPQFKFTNQMLRNNFIDQLKNEKGKTSINQLLKYNTAAKRIKNNQKHHFHKEQQSSKRDYRNINQCKGSNDQSDTPELGYRKQQPQQEELSLSNINQFQHSKQPANNELNKYTNGHHQQTKPIHQKHYIEQSQSGSDADEQNRQTLKYKHKQHKRSDGESQQPLIMEWDKRQFKDKSIKTAILNHNSHRKREQPQGIYQTKGGICFELDTRDFVKNNDSLPVYPKHRRRPQLNTRQQIIRRRQTAKIYDRKTRVKLFGYI